MNELEFHLNQLSAKDFSSRRRSAELLGGFGDPLAIKPLLKLLSDDYWQVRNTVVDAIVKIRDNATIAPLLEFLRDEDPGLRNSAMSVLHEMGEDVIAPLTNLLLTDKLEDVRIFSANTLGRMRESHAVDGLVRGLADGDENVRFACAEGLGRLGRAEAVLPLIEAMGKEETWARFSYITALGLIGDELACPSLLGMLDDEILSFPSIISLGQIGDISALNPLAEKLGRAEPLDEVVSRALIVSLARIEKKGAFFSKVERHGFLHAEVVAVLKTIDSRLVTDLLVEMALGGDKLESEAALNLLRFIREPFPVEKLFPLLCDETTEEEVRDLILKQGRSAVEPVLARLRSGPSDETNHLIHIISLIGTEDNVAEIGAYLNSPVSETVCDALKAVGMLNGREFFPDMVGLLGSPHENIQNAALGGISLLKPREWLYDNAMELARSENVFVRRGGYRILGFTSLMGAVNLLIAGLSDESAICRAAAMQSLGYIGARDKKLMEGESFLGSVGRALVDEEKFVRLEAVLAFARINGEKTFKYLLDMLDGEDREVQNYVIRAIGRCRVAEASEKLCQMLENQDNTEQAILLCNALGRCGKREAVDCLVPFVDSIIPELASEAVAALSMIGGEKIVEEILPHLNSRSWLVCAAAINAMAELKEVSAAPIIAKLSLEKINDEDGLILVHTALKALAKIGGASEMKTVLVFLGNPECQYEAFAAVCGILGRVRERVFDIGSIANPTGRRLACLAAGFSFVDGFNEDILARLNDDYPSVRRAAALALAGAHWERSKVIPSSCLNDGDAWVVKISKNVLGGRK